MADKLASWLLPKSAVPNSSKIRITAPSAFPNDHNSGPGGSSVDVLGSMTAGAACDTDDVDGIDDDTREGIDLSCRIELIRLTSSSSVSFYEEI
jgi:hypothetical protein